MPEDENRYYQMKEAKKEMDFFLSCIAKYQQITINSALHNVIRLIWFPVKLLSLLVTFGHKVFSRQKVEAFLYIYHNIEMPQAILPQTKRFDSVGTFHWEEQRKKIINISWYIRIDVIASAIPARTLRCLERWRLMCFNRYQRYKQVQTNALRYFFSYFYSLFLFYYSLISYRRAQS